MARLTRGSRRRTSPYTIAAEGCALLARTTSKMSRRARVSRLPVARSASAPFVLVIVRIKRGGLYWRPDAPVKRAIEGDEREITVTPINL